VAGSSGVGEEAVPQGALLRQPGGFLFAARERDVHLKGCAGNVVAGGRLRADLKRDLRGRIVAPLPERDPDVVLGGVFALREPEDHLPPEATMLALVPLHPPLPRAVAGERDDAAIAVFTLHQNG